MKTVLVTGSSSGFGRDISRRFEAEGWNVAATMRTPREDDVIRTGERMLVTRLDVCDLASITAAVDATMARFGAIDAVINNAGFGLFGVFEETPRERLRAQLDVNVFGAMDVTRAVLPHMRARRTGTIVNVSSGAGVFTLPMLSAYCASKFALEGWSESLSYELAPLGIRVKIVEPGGVTETRFGERGAAETAHALPITDYAPFRARTEEAFDGLRKARTMGTSEGVAREIFAATTDESDRLRYVATNDIVPLTELRRTAGETEYLATMRRQFLFGNGR